MDRVKPAAASERASERLEEIYGEHRPRLFHLCRYLLGSSDAAQDAVHEVLLRVRRQWSSYDPARPLSSWLAGIASHYCIDLLRRRGLERRIFDVSGTAPQPESPAPSPLRALLDAERAERVRAALASLPDRYKIPLVLAYYSEMNYDEIAAVLGVGRNTVGTLIFRGKQELRRRLAGER